MVIDHINNMKWDNNVSNLQAVSASHNSRMAANDGLYHAIIHLNEADIHKCCQMISSNIRMTEIAKEFGIDYKNDPKKYKIFVNKMTSLRGTGANAWKDVIAHYDLSHYDSYPRTDSKYSDSAILYMIELYCAGYTTREIADIFGEESTKYIRKIIQGKKRKKVQI
jgi:hypothetical protein